ncbi:hypothetical protein PVAND_017851 [Polypedilum vanderplanki]|uniref:Cytochrome P450 n=1 Tax=Polypedilum vanderplanki TaxID=319348 RepID=A0A9J6B941_POLVA|nr:hypothetical protein PVAND_017851 [Polypedilum vanderplanki]
MFLSLTFLASIFITIQFYKWIKFYLKISKIPGPKNQIPFFGIINNFIGEKVGNYGKNFLEIISKTEPIQKVWFGPKIFIIPNTPEMFKTIFTSLYCVDKPRYIYGGFFANNGLLSSNGSVQEKHRKILSYSMTPKMLNQLVPVFEEKIQKFIKRMKNKIDGDEFNVFEDVAACTLEALVKGNFQYDYDCYESDLLKACASSDGITLRRIMQPWMSFEFLFKISQLSKDVKRIFGPIYSAVDKILEQNEHLRIESDDKKGIFIKQLLNLKNEFSEEEIRDEIFILIFAGSETTATTLSMCLLLLAMHKNIQNKIIEEINTKNSNDDFPYIEMVLKEVMRLFPIGPIIFRETTAEIMLESCEVPKNTTIAIPIYFLHRNENIWGKDANEFKPERFEANKIDKIHSYSFVPFSGGKRMCIGYKYAMTFMKIFIVNFFKEFEIETSLKYEEMDVKVLPTITVTQGFPIKIKKRTI